MNLCKVLIVIPGYSHLNLRMAKLLLKTGVELDIVVPYNYKLIPKFFQSFSIRAFQNAYKRRQSMEGIELFKLKVRLIHLPLYRFLLILIKEFLIEKKPLSNFFKDIIQNKLIKKLDYNQYDFVYLFDTVAYFSQVASKKNNVKNCLEVRGAHFKYSLEVNKKINALYGTSIPDIDGIDKTEASSWWFKKLTSEPVLADFLVCYSNFHKSMYTKYSSIKENNVITIPLSATIAKSRQIKSIPTGGISFVFVGNLSYVKGIPILISAWNELFKDKYFAHPPTLNFYGLTQVEEIIPMIKNSKNIIYHGALPHKELMSALKDKHDVFIFPSLFDTFGLALQEALQLNMPVISNYTSGAAELYCDGKHGFKYEDSYDPIQLKSCIEKFIEKPALVESFSKELSNYQDFYGDYDEENSLKKVDFLKTTLACN